MSTFDEISEIRKKEPFTGQIPTRDVLPDPADFEFVQNETDESYRVPTGTIALDDLMDYLELNHLQVAGKFEWRKDGVYLPVTENVF